MIGPRRRRQARSAAASLLGLSVLATLAGLLSGCGGSDSHLSVRVVADGGTMLRPGETPQFTVRVVNLGPATASDVVVRVDLPPPLAYNATTSLPGPSSGVVRTQPQDPQVHTPAPTWGAWVIPGPVTHADGTVRRSELDLSFTVTVSGAPGDYVLVPRVFSDSSEGDVAGPALAVSVVAAPQLSVTVTAEQPTVASGETLAYRVVVTNQGSGQATGLSILLVLPPQMAFDRTLKVSGNATQTHPDNPLPNSLLVRYGSWIVPAASEAGPGLLSIVFQVRCLPQTAPGRFTVSGEVTDDAGLVIPIPDSAPVVVVTPAPRPGATPRGSFSPRPSPSPTPTSGSD